MHIADRIRLAQEFGLAVQMGPERVLTLSDRIANAGHDHPELIARCKFGRSIQVRRLRTVAAKHWNPSDWVAVQAVLDEIALLKTAEHQPENILALAVLGVESDELEKVLAQLDGKAVTQLEVSAESEALVSPAAVSSYTRPERQSGKRRN